MLYLCQVYHSLLRYKGHLDFYFSDIDVNWLKAYESWLREQKLAENTIGIRFRTLRVIYNIALTEGLVKNGTGWITPPHTFCSPRTSVPV